MMKLLNKRWKRGLLATLILVLAFIAFMMILQSAPKPQRKAPLPEMPPVVQVTAIDLGNQRPKIQVGGTVLAAQQLEILAQVEGQISWLNSAAIPGATLKRHTLLAKIDPVDYQNRLDQLQSGLIQAESSLAIEQGRAELALEEYELSQIEYSDEDKALVLREPQLLAAKAVVADAKSALAIAKQNLKRTEVRLPFDGMLMSRSTALGAQASMSGPLFSAVATDEFWLEVKIPRDFYAVIDRDQPAQIVDPLGRHRAATILNILPDVDSGDRQVKLILQIKSPLDESKGPVVFVNDYVDVNLYGEVFSEAYQVPRDLLIDDRYVWVVNSDQMFKRTVEVIYLGSDQAWIRSEFEPGDQLLITKLEFPTEKMAVSVWKASQ